MDEYDKTSSGSTFTTTGSSTVYTADAEPSTSGGAGIVGKGSTTADGPGPYVMAADTLTGNSVYSSDAVLVGHIKDIMLDVSSGHIAYAVLASGGLLGLGAKLLAVPWNALTLDTDRKCFVLSVAGDVVKSEPGFDKDAWPSFADAQWGSRLHRHYNTVPYWSATGERLNIDQPVTSAPRTGFSEGL